jgi:hypothetical protein
MSKRTNYSKPELSFQPSLAAAPASSTQQESMLATSPRNKRRVSGSTITSQGASFAPAEGSSFVMAEQDMQSASAQPPVKKSRTNTPWTAAEEQRLKTMREAGNSWADIAKVCDIGHVTNTMHKGAWLTSAW